MTPCGASQADPPTDREAFGRAPSDALVHDLNNVLQTIEQAAEIISADPANAPFAAIISRGVDRARRMLAPSGAELQRTVQLAKVAGRAAEFARDYCSVHAYPRPSIVREVPETIYLHTRAADIERTLANLLINACDAGRRGRQDTLDIHVTAGQEGGMARIIVADNGPGIPPEVLPNVFEPGFTTAGEGRGWGLHSVRTCVKAEGGDVSARNREGGGALFEIRLPCTNDSGES